MTQDENRNQMLIGALRSVRVQLSGDTVWEFHPEPPKPIVVTPKMVHLAASTDRRKAKRGKRIYFARNGKDAPIHPLESRINIFRMQRAAAALCLSFEVVSRRFIDGVRALNLFHERIGPQVGEQGE